MNIRIPGHIFRGIVIGCLVLGTLVTTLDLIGVAIAFWIYALPGVLVAGAAIWWALARWDPFEDPQPSLGERVLARAAQLAVYLCMLALGIGAVVFIGHFLWTHTDYLILTGLVLFFFLGVFLWSLLPGKTPAAGEAGSQAASEREDIVR